MSDLVTLLIRSCKNMCFRPVFSLTFFAGCNEEEETILNKMRGGGNLPEQHDDRDGVVFPCECCNSVAHIVFGKVWVQKLNKKLRQEKVKIFVFIIYYVRICFSGQYHASLLAAYNLVIYTCMCTCVQNSACPVKNKIYILCSLKGMRKTGQKEQIM